MKTQTNSLTLNHDHPTLVERARDVKARCPIGAVAAQYRDVRPSGTSRFVCRCLCGRNTDRRPSFTLYKRDNGFHCFACGAHGSVIDLVMLAERCDFRTALLRLEGSAGFTNSQRVDSVPAERQQVATLTTIDQRILKAAADWYHTQLLHSPMSLHYLMAERGLTHETIRKLKIGYSNGRMLIRHIHAQSLPVTRLLILGLVTERYNELMCQRVIFPVLQEERVVYMIGRATSREGKRVKYLGLPDGPVHKQPLVVGTPRRGVIWVEGPFDVAALVQWGLDVDYLLVGLLGTVHSQKSNILDRCSPAMSHYIALDEDDAGEQASEKLLSSLLTSRVGNVIRLRWAGAKDCGELLTHGQRGQNNFLHALATASSF